MIFPLPRFCLFQQPTSSSCMPLCRLHLLTFLFCSPPRPSLSAVPSPATPPSHCMILHPFSKFHNVTLPTDRPPFFSDSLKSAPRNAPSRGLTSAQRSGNSPSLSSSSRFSPLNSTPSAHCSPPTASAYCLSVCTGGMRAIGSFSARSVRMAWGGRSLGRVGMRSPC